LRKLYAFLCRGYLIEASYKFAFVSKLVGVVVPIFMLHFAGQLVDSGKPAALAKYGGNYFQFAVVGLALSQYFVQAIRTSAENLRRAQLSGVLEAVLSTGTRPAHFVLYDSAYGYLTASINFVAVFVIAIVFLGTDFSHVNPFGVFLAMVLGTAAVGSLGFFSAAWTVIFKAGDPIPLLVGGVGTLLSGVYFPVSLFPRWIRFLANLLPFTHALEATRLAISSDASLRQLEGPLLWLGIMTAILLPLSLWCFEAAVRAARRNGTLLHY
jgi:ABC-2 type transport system permease protein